MIIFRTLDYNLGKIEKASGLEHTKTEFSYVVNGLIQSDNPPIKIEYKGQLPNKKTEKTIKDFLKRNGIAVVFEKPHYLWNDVTIGFRKDVREHFFLCAAVTHSIIYYLENKLDLYSFVQDNNLGCPRIKSEENNKKALTFQTTSFKV